MYQIGSDPEIFAQAADGKIISVIDMIPGTKENPHPIDELGHMIQVDNIAFEYNIPPCNTEEEFAYSIDFVKEYLRDIAKENGLDLSELASAEIDPDQLLDPRAKRFGCDPDLNVYTSSFNTPPDSNTTLRCVGGHVAMSWENPSVETAENIVKLFDIFLTAPAVIYDKDTRRRELYGKPGSFRIKEWGVECRALSNFWIHTEELTRWVYKQSIKLLKIAVENPQQAEEIIENFSDQALDIIANNDVEGANQLLQILNNLN